MLQARGGVKRPTRPGSTMPIDHRPHPNQCLDSLPGRHSTWRGKIPAYPRARSVRLSVTEKAKGLDHKSKPLFSGAGNRIRTYDPLITKQ